MIKALRLAIVTFLLIPVFGSGQALNVPTLQTFYGVNPDHHLIGFSKHYSSGFGWLAFGTTTAISPSQYFDKFFIGPSYTFGDISNTRFSASISPGVWTKGLIYSPFYNFPDNLPLYPINYGVATQINYRLNDQYLLRLGLNFNEEGILNTSTVGFTYDLGETFFPLKTDSTLKKINLAVTYGANLNGHVFLLETTFSNNLGFHAITLSDALHPSRSMVDRYYLGPSFTLNDDLLGPFDFTMSLGIYTYGLVRNFPFYPFLPASNLKLDYNWKQHLAISTGVIHLPVDESRITNFSNRYTYLGLCYSI